MIFTPLPRRPGEPREVAAGLSELLHLLELVIAVRDYWCRPLGPIGDDRQAAGLQHLMVIDVPDRGSPDTITIGWPRRRRRRKDRGGIVKGSCGDGDRWSSLIRRLSIHWPGSS